jgi:hypothetical protein
VTSVSKAGFPATRVLIVLTATVLGFRLISPLDLSAANSPMILSLGDDSYIPWSEVGLQTGAVVHRELGEWPLTDFSALVLSNISYTSLPEAVRHGLGEYLAHGGSVLVTGGKQSYGSGGYAATELADLLPFRPSRDDWLPHPFGPTLILQPGHSILKGVEIPTMAFFNELDLNVGAIEIAQYVRAQRLPHSLIAERSVGAGAILAIALDMTLTGDWRDRDRFTQNCVEYLLQRSRIEPPKKQSDLYHGVIVCCAT